MFHPLFSRLFLKSKLFSKSTPDIPSLPIRDVSQKLAPAIDGLLPLISAKTINTTALSGKWKYNSAIITLDTQETMEERVKNDTTITPLNTAELVYAWLIENNYCDAAASICESLDISGEELALKAQESGTNLNELVQSYTSGEVRTPLAVTTPVVTTPVVTNSKYRFFYRSANESRKQTTLYTCLLDSEMTADASTNKHLSVLPHAEDPRVILYKGAWFVFYTDGYKMAVAKLEYTTCNTIYTHYLIPPEGISFKGGDGREKNWIPHIVNDEIHVLYSACPLTFFIYKDTEKALVIRLTYSTEQTIKSGYGGVRGGCPPVDYSADEKIWFFHTNLNNTYHMGAYITRDDRVTHITYKPVLSGAPIIFPCGAITTDEGWLVTMGVNDKYSSVVHISRSIIADNLVQYDDSAFSFIRKYTLLEI